MLDYAKSLNAKGYALIDDIDRLFRRCDKNARVPLMHEIEPYGEFIFDLRRAKQFSHFTRVETGAVVSSGLTLTTGQMLVSFAPNRNASKAKSKTTKARTISAKARARNADRCAEQVRSLRNEIDPNMGFEELARLFRPEPDGLVIA